jgi:hypothetical protein
MKTKHLKPVFATLVAIMFYANSAVASTGNNKMAEIDFLPIIYSAIGIAIVFLFAWWSASKTKRKITNRPFKIEHKSHYLKRKRHYYS